MRSRRRKYRLLPPTQSTPFRDDVGERQSRRRAMIAEAAYYRAASRGFSGGDPVADWLAAEVEIDARLRAAQPAGRSPRSAERSQR
jgi:hypothetical protein